MLHKVISVSLFFLSLTAFIISIRLFYNQAVFVDEYNLSPDIVTGGEF